MTEKLFYNDPSLLEFEATIREHKATGELHEVVLDRTCFFPGGGGQPADRGTLGAARVVDVEERGDAIVHFVDAAPGAEGTHVRGAIDAERRRDFMVQHTGQHILSQALLTVGKLPTVSVHFGDETATIELEASSVAEGLLREAEKLANTIIRENREVKIHEVDPRDAGRFPLRRTPPEVGRLRVVEVGSFDWAACSGLHVTATGQIGLIKIVAQEKIRGRTRIHALIGDRAMDDYGRKVTIIQSLMRLLTCGEADIPARVEELARNARENEKELERLQVECAASDAEAAVGVAKSLGKTLLVRRILQSAGPAYLKAFAEQVLINPGRVVIVIDRGPEAFQWIAAHSLGNRIELPALVRPILGLLNAKGGGRGAWMQGAGAPADGAEAFAEAVEGVLTRALT
jgi:alanyl-tRNA synthetase